ncbi:MAG TPA: hypothetical protein VG737_11490, partial [Cyclobacteriaceae bacterium]|nr:hypothetical protein [Cyclobacteriaceae bacterium]
LAYSLSKLFHLPSLVLVLCFGLVLNNFRFFENARTRRILSFDKLSEVTRELKMMTTETAFIIRTFFFLLFGYSINLETLQSTEVLFMGLAIIFLTIVVRFFFLRFFLAIKSAPITLIAPRGLITILLFYSIPETMRLEGLSDGVLLMVIAFTGIAMTVGLLLNKQSPGEKIEEAV